MELQRKSYFGESIEAALERGARELGLDAMLLESRETPPEFRHLGEFEVVFGIEAAAPAPAGMETQLTELRAQIDRLYAALANRRQPLRLWHPSPLASAMAALTDAGVSDDLAEEVLQQIPGVHALRGAVAPDSPALPKLDQAIRGGLAAMIPVDSSTLSKNGRRVIALVGPPGAGKTTTVVKLAVLEGLSRRRSVHLISLDSRRIGAYDQLRSFAAILGVTYDAVSAPEQLAQALNAASGAGLVLIDTAGYSASGWDHAGVLAGALAGAPGIEVHLAAPASMNLQDLERVVERFSVFRPEKLILTKLDETSLPGAVLSLAIQAGIPLSYFTDGQSIPEDIRPASAEHLVQLTMGAGPALRRDAA